jgi:hypothetical protein
MKLGAVARVPLRKWVCISCKDLAACFRGVSFKIQKTAVIYIPTLEKTASKNIKTIEVNKLHVLQ